MMLDADDDEYCGAQFALQLAALYLLFVGFNSKYIYPGVDLVRR